MKNTIQSNTIQTIQTTIEKGSKIVVSYFNAQDKERYAIRTIRQDSKGCYVSIFNAKQYIDTIVNVSLYPTNNIQIPFIHNDKVVVRTIRRNDKGLFVSINNEKHYINDNKMVFSVVEINSNFSPIPVILKHAPKTEVKTEVKQPVKPVKEAKQAKVKEANKVESDNEENEELAEINAIIKTKELAHDYYYGTFEPSLMEMKLTPQQQSTISIILERFVQTSYTNDKGKTVKKRNLYTDKEMKERYYNMLKGYKNDIQETKGIYNATTYNELYFAIVYNLLESNVLKKANKFLLFGTNNKEKEMTFNESKSANEWDNISSGSGKVMFMDALDVKQEVLTYIPEHKINERTFDSVQFFYGYITLIIKNILRTEKRRIHFNNDDKKVLDWNNPNMSRSSEKEAILFAESLHIFDEKELKVIALTVNGYKKVDIDKIIGQRTDRIFNRIKRKAMEANLLEDLLG